MHKYSYVYLNIFNITRIANAVQRHSLLSGHYDCNVLRFSIVRNVKYHQMAKRSQVFECICHCLCLCCCLFVGQVMFSHHSEQMSKRSQFSKIPFLELKTFTSVTIYSMNIRYRKYLQELAVACFSLNLKHI